MIADRMSKIGVKNRYEKYYELHWNKCSWPLVMIEMQFDEDRRTDTFRMDKGKYFKYPTLYRENKIIKEKWMRLLPSTIIMIIKL